MSLCKPFRPRAHTGQFKKKKLALRGKLSTEDSFGLISIFITQKGSSNPTEFHGSTAPAPPAVGSGLHALAKVRTEFACPLESRLPPSSLPRDLVTSPARSLGAKYEFDESGSGRPNSDVTFFHGREVLCHVHVWHVARFSLCRTLPRQ